MPSAPSSGGGFAAGSATVVVGTRSGVFAPVQNLGLVVIDEEHDQSYKQQETPRYNGRDVAIVRAQAAGAVVVLGSATPSLESRYNAERGKYTLIELPERIEQRPMPDVEVIDMRQEFLETRKLATFSRRLVETVTERLEQARADHAAAQPARLFELRRVPGVRGARGVRQLRGDADLSSARSPHAVPLLQLRAEGSHACARSAAASICSFIGTGSEKVEEELHRDFPTARIARMDRDTVSGKRHFESILHGFREGDFDILVGTQMIAKGHDIPNVTLVGVVSADIGLGLPDFRVGRAHVSASDAGGRARGTRRICRASC